MKKVAIKALVSGKVQKVWFRANTQIKAIELGIVGQALNMPNGDVEVKACGDKEKVAQLVDWLHIGSEKAKVEQVVVTELTQNEVAQSKIISTTEFITG